MKVSDIEARTFDLTTAELSAAISLRYGTVVLFAHGPVVPERDTLPVSLVVKSGWGEQTAAARLAALRAARTAIDFLVVQIENGNAG